MTSHDRLFKELIETFFMEFLELFFPEVAAYGIRAIPAAWRLAVLSCRPHLSFEACRQPRPIFCWPVDAYQVAERLVTL